MKKDINKKPEQDISVATRAGIIYIAAAIINTQPVNRII